MKRVCALLILSCFLLTSCSAFGESNNKYQKFSHYFFDTFDTIITLIGYTQTQEEFTQYASIAESEMRRYHQIFDQYNPYEGVANVYAVNQNAAGGTANAEPELINLLAMVSDWQALYGNAANPAMGSVLSLWHNARTYGTTLPDEALLVKAADHCDYSKIHIDKDAGTISFADPEIRLDLGAVAKGYAAQLVAETLRNEGFSSFILNAGGNVVCGDAPMDGRTEWSVAIEDVDGSSTKVLIGAVNTSIVTSGDYQRFFMVDGKRYHHLIDPQTLYPAAHMRSVTILHPDSGFADFLSTTAFLLPYEQSRTLIESIPEAEALWTLNDGTEVWTEGFAAMIR